MSAKIAGLVWELDLPHPQLLVLLALADHAQHDGTRVHPSLGLVAWKVGYSQRQVRRIVHELVERKLLVPEAPGRGRGRTTLYRIELSAGPQKAPYQPSALKPDTVSHLNGKADTVSHIPPLKEDTVSHLAAENRTSGVIKGDTLVSAVTVEPSLLLSSAVADAIDGALERFADRGYARDDRFLEALQTAFPHLNLELEALTMAEWLLEPRHAKRPCSKNFVRNWLKRAEADRLGQERDLAQRPAPAGSPWQTNGSGTNGHYVQPQSQQRNAGPAPLKEPTPEEEARSRAERDRVKQELARRGLAGKASVIGRPP